MKQKILLLSTLICINAHANHVGSAHIINDTDQSLRAEIGIPDHSRADITIKKISQEDALRQAILHDSPEEIRNAVQAGADVNKRTNNVPPLLFAVLLRRSNVVETLLDCGATIKSQDRNCLNTWLIDYSVKLKDFKSAFILSKITMHQAYIIGKFRFLLIECTKTNNFESLHYLLKQIKNGTSSFSENDLKRFSQGNWELSTGGRTSQVPWKNFVMCSIFEMFHREIPRSFGSGWDSETCSFNAPNITINLSIILDTIQLLIDYGYNVDDIWSEPSSQNLLLPILYAKSEILELFLKNDANPNQLFAAIRMGNKRTIQTLLNYGAFVNCTDTQGKTPLALAIDLGVKQDIVELLFAHGARL